MFGDGTFRRLRDERRETCPEECAKPRRAGVRARIRAKKPVKAGGAKAGRAVDVVFDLIHTGTTAQAIRDALVGAGWFPIAPLGSPEAWHHEYRGAFQAVYDETLGKAGDRAAAYRAIRYGHLPGDMEE